MRKILDTMFYLLTIGSINSCPKVTKVTSKIYKMAPLEFQRSYRLHFGQLSGHKTPNHHKDSKPDNAFKPKTFNFKMVSVNSPRRKENTTDSSSGELPSLNKFSVYE